MQEDDIFVVGRCTTRPAVRFVATFTSSEQGQWILANSRPIDSDRAERGGHGPRTISGQIEIPQGTVVCPSCRAGSIWLCGNCRSLNCWDGASSLVTCPQCSMSGELDGSISSLDGALDV